MKTKVGICTHAYTHTNGKELYKRGLDVYKSINKITRISCCFVEPAIMNSMEFFTSWKNVHSNNAQINPGRVPVSSREQNEYSSWPESEAIGFRAL